MILVESPAPPQQAARSRIGAGPDPPLSTRSCQSVRRLDREQIRDRRTTEHGDGARKCDATETAGAIGERGRGAGSARARNLRGRSRATGGDGRLARPSGRGEARRRPAPASLPTWCGAHKDGVGTAPSRRGPEPRLVHHRPGHPERGLLSPGRSCLHPRPRPDRHRRRRLRLGRARRRRARRRVPASRRPLYRLVNTVPAGRAIGSRRRSSPTPSQDAVLQVLRFDPLDRDARRLSGSTPCSTRMLGPRGEFGPMTPGWASTGRADALRQGGRGHAVALACSPVARGLGRLRRRRPTAGSDLVEQRRLTQDYGRAEEGNVALTGEVDLVRVRGPVHAGARLRHRPRPRPAITPWPACSTTPTVLRRGLRRAAGRRGRRRSTPPGPAGRRARPLAGQHVRPQVARGPGDPGAIVASLSTPWGEAEGTRRRSWRSGAITWSGPATSCESAGGLLAAGGKRTRPCAFLGYLRATQMPDGHWPQNHVGQRHARSGRDPARGDRLPDPPARPRSAASGARRSRRRRLLADGPRSAAGYIVRSGPSTQQDRWENERGYTPVHPRLSSSPPSCRRRPGRRAGRARPRPSYLRETADAWNDAIERWLYVTGHDLAQPGRRGGLLRRGSSRPSLVARPTRRTEPLSPALDPGPDQASRRRHRQPRRAWPGPVRPPGSRRPADPRHRQGDRSRS